MYSYCVKCGRLCERASAVARGLFVVLYLKTGDLKPDTSKHK